MNAVDYFRSRTTQPGPETELLRATLEVGLPYFAGSPPHTFLEPELPCGYPDIVQIHPRTVAAQPNPLAPRLSIPQLQILHLIYTSRGCTLDHLVRSSFFSRRALRIAIDALLAREFLTERSGVHRVRPLDEIFAARRIVAIEAKVSDWRTAIKQAVRNTWFASDSYILMPSQRVSRSAIDFARHYNVGILGFDGKSTRRLLHSGRSRLPSSYVAWSFNDYLLTTY